MSVLENQSAVGGSYRSAGRSERAASCVPACGVAENVEIAVGTHARLNSVATNAHTGRAPAVREGARVCELRIARASSTGSPGGTGNTACVAFEHTSRFALNARTIGLPAAIASNILMQDSVTSRPASV